jgi:Protein of unknown function (DUF3147)
MISILLRFLIGGLLVSAFAVISDVLKPKSFAGLFGAAPSIALATIGLTVASEGTHYAALEARSMVVGAIGFFVYASCVSRLLIRHKIKAGPATLISSPVWGAVSFVIRYLWLK